jgi:hypothetical protein
MLFTVAKIVLWFNMRYLRPLVPISHLEKCKVRRNYTNFERTFFEVRNWPRGAKNA